MAVLDCCVPREFQRRATKGVDMVRFDEKANQEGRKYVEDRRGRGTRRRSTRAGGGAMPTGKVGGIGGIILAIIAAVFGIPALSGGDGSSSGFDIGASGFDSGDQVAVGNDPIDPALDPDAEMVTYLGALMDDNQDVWSVYFDQAGLQYQFTTIVVFDGSVDTGCGQATSAVGPFYCPAPGDNKVYIDLEFIDELSGRFGAPGDFAVAYVIAHEVGHHIQSISGISDQIRQAQSQNPGAKNELSVRQELQADCLAGVWAYSASRRTNSDGTKIIEIGDIDEGLAAAEAVGDDRIQEMTGQQVNPHNWTHGSAAARKSWFLEGYNNGDPERCDTFAVDRGQVGL